MRRRKAFVSDVRDHQHGWSPFRVRRLAFVVSTRPLSELPAFASRPATSTTRTEDFLPTGEAGTPGAGMAKTQRVLEGCVGPSRITSSARRARLAFKCRVNGISVRTLIRGTADPFALAVMGARQDQSTTPGSSVFVRRKAPLRRRRDLVPSAPAAPQACCQTRNVAVQ